MKSFIGSNWRQRIAFVLSMLIPTFGAAEESITAFYFSCGQWIEARTANNPIKKSQLEGWMLGFLTGIATQSNNNFMKDSDAPSMFAYVDKYCRDSPLEKTTAAGVALGIELIQRKNNGP